MKNTLIAEKRYGENNLHIAANDQNGFVYDVPTNSFFKTSKDVASDLRQLREKDYNTFLILMNKKLVGRKETVPSHNLWIESRVINKLILNVTSRCNMRCSYCYANFGKFDNYESRNMTSEEVTMYINKLIPRVVKKIEVVQFFGGEPTLAEKTIEATCKHFSYLVEKNIIDCVPRFTMISNCVNISDGLYDIINKYNIRIVASLDGPKYIHDIQRKFADGSGTYEFVKDNIKRLQSFIDGIEATYTKVHVQSEMSAEKLIDYLSDEFNVSRKRISVIPVTGCKELGLTELEKDNYYYFSDWTSDDGYIKRAFFENLQSDLYCNAGYNTIALMPNGDIYPCHMYAANKSYRIGNIKDEWIEEYKEKLEQISFSSKYQRLKCRNCWIRKVCHLCTAKMTLSDKSVSELISIEACNERKKYIENRLLQLMI